MPFQVSQTVLDNNTLIHLRDNNRSTSITIIPEAGALLHEFVITVNGEPFNIIESYPVDKPVRAQVTHYFRNVKLSPWPCRLAGGTYNFNGHQYQVQRLFKDGTALHGLLFDQNFTVENQFADDKLASVSLKHVYSGYDEGYPFSYSCQVKYTLHAAALLEVETIVTNLGADPIPMADGWHPYFKLGGKVNNWQLQFNARAMVEFDDRLVPTGRLLPFDKFMDAQPIGEMQLDNCFLLGPGSPACTLLNPENKIKVSFLPEASYPYLQLFIPDHGQSIAIENISSAPDSFNNGMGLITLQPGMAHTFKAFYKAEEIG